jgi:hypothetical protein
LDLQFRSVIKKRKELIELQENSKVLRAQLRSKKKNIKTLEQLLKDASHNKRRVDDGGENDIIYI